MIMRKRALESRTFVFNLKLVDKHLTVDDFNEKLQTGDISVFKKNLYFSASLRGTSQYWAQRASVLRSLIQFKTNEGQCLPYFFTTGSCAEFHF